jgi:UDP-N-acetylmuramyl-tripeptide synthetase
MRLDELVRDVPAARIDGDPTVEVRAVRDDSRAVGAGDVFVAVKGMTVDGHAFVAGAIERGAAAIVVERALTGVNVPQVVVPSGAKALGWLAARAAGRPSDAIVMVGVTGTNGKTTTTYLVEHILAAAGHAPGVIGTVSYRYGGRTLEAPYTTPTALQVNELFATMRTAATSHVVIEVSSAALAMDRLEGVFFQVGAFSNLTQDHLDVHGTLAAYFDAKARLFRERLAPGATACVMVDDDDGWGERMAAAVAPGRRVLRVSTKRADADVTVLAARSSIGGIEATLRTPSGRVDVRSAALFGDYNLANVALATAIAEGLALPLEAVTQGIAALRGVPGRVERVENAHGLDVFVDYAHTPDALERVIAALRPLTAGRLIVVFGCGGDRDPGKRPKMGKIVAEGADLAVVTSDNPRTEEAAAIVDMVLAGVREASARETPIVEVDRRRAIARAVAAARPGRDVVLIAGKGHEDYQIIGKTKIHFDDREEAARAIAALASAPAGGAEGSS